MSRSVVSEHAVYRTEREVAPGHAAARGGAVRALGHAVAPRTETLVLPRGTHRTRVSEMRLAPTRAATPRPELPDTGRCGLRAGTERDRVGSVHPRTG